MNNLYFVLGAGALAMVYAFWKTSWINNQDEGSDRMKQIGASISNGAMAFLKAEYRVLVIFVVIVACLLAYAASSQGDSWLVSISFLSFIPPISFPFYHLILLLKILYQKNFFYFRLKNN